MEAGISLGSNLGNRIDNLRRARALLDDTAGIRVTASAPVYETEPVDVPPEFEGYCFLNTLLIIETGLAPLEILAAAKEIERRLGRARPAGAPRNGPRVIDLDIVFIADLAVDRPDLRVPHPCWRRRAFIARPLADLRPDLVLPGDSRPVNIVLAGLDTGGVRPFADVPWWP